MKKKRFSIHLLIGYILLAIGLSPATYTLFPTIGNIIEPFLLLGVILITKFSPYKIPFKKTFYCKKISLLILTLFLLSLIGIITPTGFQEKIYQHIYADFRSIFLFAFTYLIAGSTNWTPEEKNQFFRNLFWFIIPLGFFVTLPTILENAFADDNSIERTLGVPAHFLFIQSFLYYKSKKYWVHLPLLAIGAFYAISTYARINIAFFVIHLFIVLIPLIFTKTKSLKLSFFRLLILIFIALAALKYTPVAINYYSNTEGGRRQQERLLGASTNFQKEEGERFKSLYIPFIELEYYILPEGIGWRNHIYKISTHYNKKILSTQDSSWFYLLYHFGLIGGIPLLFYIFTPIFKHLFSVRSWFSIEGIEKTFILIAFIIGFFTQGIFFTVPQNAIAGGLMLAIISVSFHKQEDKRFRSVKPRRVKYKLYRGEQTTIKRRSSLNECNSISKE